MKPLVSLPNQEPVGLSPQQIETRLATLIENALKQRSTAMASVITQHISALCAHPDYRGTWEELCAYRRLFLRWNCLAWLDEMRVYPAARASNTVLQACD